MAGHHIINMTPDTPQYKPNNHDNSVYGGRESGLGGVAIP